MDAHNNAHDADYVPQEEEDIEEIASSSVPRRAKAQKKGPNPSQWWDEVILVGPPPRSGGARKWRCKFCKIEKTGGTDRVKKHLVGEGKGSLECTAIDDATRERLLSFSNVLDGISAERNKRLNAARCVAALVPPPTAAPSTIVPSCNVGGTSSSGLGSYFSPPAAKKRQKNIQDAIDPERKDRLWRAIGRYFIYNKISFNVIRDNHYKYMMIEAAHYGPNIELPKYENLRVSLVAREKKEVTLTLQNLRGQWVKWGVSLIVDRWSDTQGRHIHGIIACCRGRNYYLNSYDITKDGKFALNLANIWKEAIKEVGENNVLQIVGDGEQSNRKAGKMIQIEFPHITFSPCMAHCINNLFKDFTKIPHIANVVEKGNKIVTFVKNHSKVCRSSGRT